MASNESAPLVVRNLCKNYPAFQLKPLSFALEAGKITGFIGRNGAGKTTTINAVLSLIRPDGGEVTFSGLTVSKSPVGTTVVQLSATTSHLGAKKELGESLRALSCVRYLEMF